MRECFSACASWALCRSWCRCAATRVDGGLTPRRCRRPQIGAAAALRLGDDDVRAAVAEWERRHEEVVRQCDGLPLVPAHGGWSALFDAEACGLKAPELSRRLLDQKVAATPMTDAWGGAVATRHVRLVFSNEPIERLALLGERLQSALA